MVVTSPTPLKKPSRGGPSFATGLLMFISFGMMVVSFQNCSVDLAPSTPGASTTGACGSPSDLALSDIQPIVENFLKTSCATCHGRNTGTFQTGFFTPDSTADSNDPEVQKFAYIQICARGGKAVSTKIADPAHGGGSFSNTSFDLYLDTHF